MDSNEHNTQTHQIVNDSNANGYAISGHKMLIATAVLFFLVLVMVCLHIYVRWYLLRSRRPQLRHNRRAQLFFYVDPIAATAMTVASRGLHASVITSLPVFAYSAGTQLDPVECAVCLSEFREGEAGRVLPNCSHNFHIDCIDMWFHSHSTCPLCRAPVEPVPEMSIPGSSSGFCAEWQHEEEQDRSGEGVSSSIGFVRKPSSLVDVTIEVPRRNESFGDSSSSDSPSNQSSFRSPMSRMLSLTRILSRDRKASVSPSSGSVAGCSSVAELDAERGGRVETQ